MIRCLALALALGGCQAIFPLEDKQELPPSGLCEDDALQLCFDFEDDLDDGALDQSGFGHEGELSDPEGAMRGSHRAIAVDDDSSVRVDGASSLDARASMTFELWFGFDVPPAGDAGLLARHGHYRITLRGDLRVRCAVVVSSGIDHEAISTDAVSAGWHHVACVKDDTVLRIYIDGQLRDTRRSVSVMVPTRIPDPLYLGLDTDATGTEQLPFDGTLDDVRMFSRALSDSEVAANFVAFQ